MSRGVIRAVVAFACILAGMQAMAEMPLKNPLIRPSGSEQMAPGQYDTSKPAPPYTGTSTGPAGQQTPSLASSKLPVPAAPAAVGLPQGDGSADAAATVEKLRDRLSQFSVVAIFKDRLALGQIRHVAAASDSSQEGGMNMPRPGMGAQMSPQGGQIAPQARMKIHMRNRVPYGIWGNVVYPVVEGDEVGIYLGSGKSAVSPENLVFYGVLESAPAAPNKVEIVQRDSSYVESVQPRKVQVVGGNQSASGSTSAPGVAN